MYPRFAAVFSIAILLAIASVHAVELQERYTFDINGADSVGAAPLMASGDSVSFQSAGGKVGGFVRLGGSDDFLIASLDSGSPLSVLGSYAVFRPFSVSFWVRQAAADATSGTQSVFGLTTASTDTSTYNTGFAVITRESSGGLGVRVRARNAGGGDTAGEISTGFSVSDGTWHHVVAVYEAGRRSVYIDGVLKGINSTPIAITTDPIQYFTVGAFRRAGNILDDFKGDIDDLQIYSGALTAEDVFQLYSVPGSVVTASSEVNDITLADLVDPLIGAIDTGSCVPGPVLPHSSIYPSPDTVAAAAGGFKSGSNVVGFSQVHASGSGSSTMSYGNFLLSPDIGNTIRINESDHGSPITNVTARPYSYRGTLGTWNTNCTIAAAAHSAIYRFEFPATTTARLYMDVARKLNKTNAMTNGTISIDLAQGTISGGGTFSGNWNPASYNLYFYAKIDKTPTSGGTFVGSTIRDGTLSASIGSTAQRLGGWVTLNTTQSQVVHVKIAISFASVNQAKAWLESEIPAWDLDGIETDAKNRWNTELAAVRTPGISFEEGRKLYTALYHSLIQPRDRTGDAAGWPATAQFWDDHYTTWDMWQTLFPLLSIIQPNTLASVVNSYGERYARNGRAEGAFIQGRDSQVGQGGDDVDLVIGDAYAKNIPGIDWEKAWALMKFNAGRRTPNYRNLGYVTIGEANTGYDFRLSSGSSTLGFAYGDWCASQVARGLGHTADADALLTRSRNWRNVWDAALTGDGFSGFVHGRNANGSFDTSSATDSSGFYQGSCWNYSYNVPHERAAVIDLMGGRPRFLQRLGFAFGKRNNAYIDNTNEVCFQSTWLFALAGRPHLTSYWADQLRDLYGTYSMPGDEDSGAMSSLYFFATAGFFPIAGQDVYYLHGPRVPRIEFHQPNGKTFTITAQNAGGANLYVQSAMLNGAPLASPTIKHSDITNGGTLAFVMGPNPSTWGTGSDFAEPLLRELVLPVTGPWTSYQGSPQITNPDSPSPTWTATETTDRAAFASAFPAVTLGQAGDGLTLSATVKFTGLAAPLSGAESRFAWGLFSAAGNANANGWVGYLATNDSSDSTGTRAIWKKPAGNTTTFHAASGGISLTTDAMVAPNFEDGTYRLVLSLVRNPNAGLDYYAALIRVADGVLLASFTGADPSPATMTFDRAGLRCGMQTDSIEITDCKVVSRRTSYAGRSIVVPSGGMFYLDSGEIDAAGLVNNGVVEISGGSVSLSGAATNSGIMRLKGDSDLLLGDTLTNTGTLDTISQIGKIVGPVDNSGVELTRESIKFDTVAIQGDDLTLQFTAYSGHAYQLQQAAGSNLSGPWENVHEPVSGNDAPVAFEIADGALVPNGFFRIRVDP